LRNEAAQLRAGGSLVSASRELVKYSPAGGGVLDRSKREDGMNRIDLKREMEKDIEMYKTES
jgi:hypothetical protein